MALLDDLKKQAQQKSARDSVDLSKTLQRDEVNWHYIAPKLFILLDYFKDLVDTLNLVASEDAYRFNLMKNIVFDNLHKRNFRIKKELNDSLRSFSVRYDLQGEINKRIAVSNSAVTEKLRNLLKQHNIKFSEVTEGKDRTVIIITPIFTTKFTYSADVKACCIVLDIENYDGIWTQTLRYKPDAIDDNLMDETAKYMLGKPNRFMELSGYTMPDEMRSELRKRLDSKPGNPKITTPATEAETKLTKPEEINQDKSFNFLKLFKNKE